ncbi:hypothetical protein J6590_012699 [Homalodisca vitripennis]|nr:hypothetical protein J6590_012699 [Homalodisca vitripennis]
MNENVDITSIDSEHKRRILFGKHILGHTCPATARKWYAIFNFLDKGGEFPQEDLIGCFGRFVELLKP